MFWFVSWGLLLYSELAGRVSQKDVGYPVVQTPELGRKPNIILILSDDQDMQLNSLAYMPHVQKQLVARGTLFRRHYCTIALCCPSRVSLWTGKAAHNTNVTDVNPPYGHQPEARVGNELT